MAVPRLTPAAYQRITRAALWLLGAIIVTGAVVRLTGSGLGCTSWPNCAKGRLVAPLSLHPMVEFVNRVVTGLVSFAVIAAVLGSLVRVPRRRDLTWLSLSLVAGVIGQIALGGITVLTDLNPTAVQSHFVLSMAILAAAVVLNYRAGEEGRLRSTVATDVRRWAAVVTVLTGLAIVTGTVVTGTGPHGGDEKAKRFDFTIEAVARVHSITVIVAVAASLWLVYLARRRAHDWAMLGEPLTAYVWIAVLQGVVGYSQYFSGVPVWLVALHIVGAIAVWVAALRLVLACRAPIDAASPDDRRPAIAINQ